MRKENDLIFAVFKTNVLDQAQLGINVQWYLKIARMLYAQLCKDVQ